MVANGTEQLDQVEPRGKEVRMTRTYETLDGKPLTQPLRVGEACAVRLTIDLEKAQDFLIVEDRRPANCEYADDQATLKIRGTWANTEFRDDRVCLFFTHLSAGKHEIIYYLRARRRAWRTFCRDSFIRCTRKTCMAKRDRIESPLK